MDRHHQTCCLLPAACCLRLTANPMPSPPPLDSSQVREVSENPLAKVAKSAAVAVESQEGKKAPKAMETQVLEQSIHKICSLLSVRLAGPFASACAGSFARLLQGRLQALVSRPLQGAGPRCACCGAGCPLASMAMVALRRPGVAHSCADK